MKWLFLIFSLCLNLLSESFDDALLEAKKTNKLLLVELEMEFCPYCERMEKFVLSKEEVKSIIQEHYIFVKLDIHKDTIPENLTSRMTPTFYFLTSDGEKILKEVKGAPSKSDFINYLNHIYLQERK